MGLFTFIVCFLILLLVIIVVGSIQQLSLWISTRKNNEFVVMIIPALVSLITFILTIIITYLLLKAFKINSLNTLYSMFMKWEYSFNDYIATILGYILCSVVYIILQALCLKLVNINYYKIRDFIKYKILKKEEIKTLAASEAEQEGKVSVDLTHNTLPVKRAKISFFHYIAASLFAFAISFFSIFGLIYIGIELGQRYIS